MGAEVDETLGLSEVISAGARPVGVASQGAGAWPVGVANQGFGGCM